MCLIIIFGKNEIASTICFVGAAFSIFFLIKTYPPAPITTTSYSCSTTGYLLPAAAAATTAAVSAQSVQSTSAPVSAVSTAATSTAISRATLSKYSS